MSPRARREMALWILQRLTAIVLAVAVIVHLVTIMLAVRGGLSAAEILARTRGNVLWLAFYCLFATTAGLHAAIGLRSIVAETVGLRGGWVDAVWLIVGVLIAACGIRAAIGLYT